MDAATTALGALGVFGLISAVLVGGLMLVLVPFWSIFDVAVSRRETPTKVLLILLIFFTWTLGALIYALFLTESCALRRFTIISTVIAVILAIASAILLFSGAAIHSTRENERRAVEEQRVREQFRPAAIDPSTVAPFKAIHVVEDGPSRGSAAVADFTLSGPAPASALNIDDRVRHIVFDENSGRYYGITQHEVGVVHPVSREFEKIPVDPSLAQDFSWPKGLSLDAATGEVVVMTSHVDTDFFIFTPATKTWTKVPTGVRGSSFTAMTYSPAEQMFYLLGETRDAAIGELHRFNRAGAALGALKVTPAIPYSAPRDGTPQMAFSSGKIIVILPREGASASILAVDPTTGTVSAAATAP